MLNRVTLIGHVGKDPETGITTTGKEWARFSIAMSEAWRDKETGEKKEKVEWANVAVWGDGLVRVVKDYVRKGSRLYVEGKFSTREYEKDGIKRWATDVVIQGFGGTIKLLDRKGGNGQRDQAPMEDEPDGPSGPRNGNGGVSPSNGLSKPIDDEIPFSWLIIIGSGLLTAALGGVNALV